MGEGGWCDSTLSIRGCLHIQQDLNYQTDRLDCVTLVNMTLALIGSRNLLEFKQNLFKIAYGANQFSNGFYSDDELSYRNRNNFISASFNLINQQEKRLEDVTSRGVFTHISKRAGAAIDIAKWFAFQDRPNVIASHVRVLKDSYGDQMADKVSSPEYTDAFSPQFVTIQYIPKNFLVKKVSLPKNRIIYPPDEKKSIKYKHLLFLKLSETVTVGILQVKIYKLLLAQVSMFLIWLYCISINFLLRRLSINRYAVNLITSIKHFVALLLKSAIVGEAVIKL